MVEESVSEQQAIIGAWLRKYPELAVPELTIRYGRVLDEHPFYAGVVAATHTTEGDYGLDQWRWTFDFGGASLEIRR